MDIFVESDGFLSWIDRGGRCHKVRCALGPGGVGEKTAEGDGITPIGVFPLRRVMVRSDRITPPQTALPVSALKKSDGWCE